MSAVAPAPKSSGKLEKKPIKFSNLLLGAGLNMFEVTTLGQPLEVVKTTMAANRGDKMASALGRVWARGGVFGCMFNIYLPTFPAFFYALRTCPAADIPTPQSTKV